MSKNRSVTCTVVNNSGFDLTYNTDAQTAGNRNESNGTYSTSPVTTLLNGQTTTAFAIQKTGGSMVGCTGWVSYFYGGPQGGQVIFMFNNPYNSSGSGYNSNCWFYVVFQGNDGAAIGKPLSLAATNNFDLNFLNPVEDDDMSITVNLNSI
jgi:hypothetical protein